MKKLMSLLFHHEQGNWWTLRESDGGNPPTERTYMFVYTALVTAIKSKLSNLGAKDETHL